MDKVLISVFLLTLCLQVIFVNSYPHEKSTFSKHHAKGANNSLPVKKLKSRCQEIFPVTGLDFPFVSEIDRGYYRISSRTYNCHHPKFWNGEFYILENTLTPHSEHVGSKHKTRNCFDKNTWVSFSCNVIFSKKKNENYTTR